MLQKALMCPNCGNEEEWRGEEWSGGLGWSGHGGRDHVLTISGRRTYYG